jgi:hypothetical protein
MSRLQHTQIALIDAYYQHPVLVQAMIVKVSMPNNSMSLDHSWHTSPDGPATLTLLDRLQEHQP